MAKSKSKSSPNRASKKPSTSQQQQAPISQDVLQVFKESFDSFDQLSADEKISLYGDAEYLQQFWKHFAAHHPDLLDRVKEKDLPIYLQALEKSGFTLSHLVTHSPKVHAEFGSKVTEMQVIQNSLTQLHTYCDDSTHALPSDLFSRFASFVGFHPKNHIINIDGKLKIVDDLFPLREAFVQQEHLTLSVQHSDAIEQLLSPRYAPTERVIVQIAITKITKELSGKLQSDFVARFPLPIDIFSNYQDVLAFKQEWLLFLSDHAADIDKDLAKRLDDIIVTNADIAAVFAASNKKYPSSAQGEQYFRQVFSKVATQQLFDQVERTQQTVDRYLKNIATIFKEFPPYINEITKIYPFNHEDVARVDLSFSSDVQAFDTHITDLETQYLQASPTEKKQLRQKIRAIQQQKELRKWQAYTEFLSTQHPQLGIIFTQLVDHKFDFSVLSLADQQVLVTVLVEHKLKDALRTKMPELLDVDAEDLSLFFHDLFDLSKMTLALPTRQGNIPISFVKKAFMPTTFTQLPSLSDLEGLQNLPLDFVVRVDSLNENFFEHTPIFDSLYTNFTHAEGTTRINDSYKVSLTRDGQTVEGYLSAYCPLDEYNEARYGGKALYLYTEPVTSPHDTRKLVTWPHDPTMPVVIKHTEEKDFHLNVLDRQVHLNGEALGALLFGYVLGQQTQRVVLSPEKEHQLAQQLGKLHVYQDKATPIEETSVTSTPESSLDMSAKEKFIATVRKSLRGFSFPKDAVDGGFVEGARLFIPRNESELYPKGVGRTWMNFEIVRINEAKGTFTIKPHGGELSLGSSETKTNELPMTAAALDDLRMTFGDLYKAPDIKNMSMESAMQTMEKGGMTKDLSTCFGNVQRKDGQFVFSMGDQTNQKVEYFGRYEPTLGEAADQENNEQNLTLYKITYNSNHTVTLSGTFRDGTTQVKYTRDMDYPTFLIFIKEKGIMPKTEQQVKDLKQKYDYSNQETPTTNHGFSINNIIGFFKNGASKVKDAIKKYDDERTEEFTDRMVNDGLYYKTIANMFGPFSRIATSFETIGAEYFAERDNRVWKKVEKRKKYYEDSDFGLIYGKYLEGMVKGTLVIKPHYKAAALLLAMIAKGKGPYNRNPEFAAKGMRVNILMGPEHQDRYLRMREKLIKELHQGSSSFGPVWIDNKKNEILELEMKYIVHVMDARQLGIQDGDKTKYYFYGKYSHTFIDELEKGYNTFFSQGNVEEGYNKVKGASFDFARSEFHRLLADRPQQAIPFLKVMATKAMNESQWKAFEVAVMVGMLSGVFLTMTMSDTQGMIKNICRKRGFVPGVWAKNIYQRDKLIGLLNLFSNNQFGTEMKKNGIDFAKFAYNDMSGGTKKLIQRADPGKPEKDRGVFQKWVLKGDTLSDLSNFFKLTGKNVEGKTLLDLYEDPKTSAPHKEIIQEFLENSNEKHEDGDPEVGKNRSALTGSILTQNQNNIHQMMKFNGQGFAGEDGDAVQNQEAFFERMRDAIPKRPLQSSIQVKFFVDKFFTWFDEKGFSTSTKVELIKRLKWCQQHPHSPDVDDVLYYSICGEVYKSLGRVTIPPQFEDAMLAWKDFFKINMATILTPTILTESFGGVSYQQDYERYQPQLDPWENCAQLFDPTQRQIFISSLLPEQRQAINQHYREITRDPYINRKLYETADVVEKTCFKENRFKNKLFSSPVTSASSASHRKATGARIANPEVLHNLSEILQNKSPSSSRQSDDFVDMSVDTQDTYSDLD